MSRHDIPGEEPWWHVYIAEWCGCILTVSLITYLPGWFPVAFPAVFVYLNVLLLWYVLPNCRGFNKRIMYACLTTFWCSLCVSHLRGATKALLVLSRSTLVFFINKQHIFFVPNFRTKHVMASVLCKNSLRCALQCHHLRSKSNVQRLKCV